MKTAIVYSLDDLFAYNIEIKEGDKSYYITENQQPILFKNMKDVRYTLLKEKVTEAHLALSKTYDEVGSNSSSPKIQDRYDYSSINLDVSNE